MNTITIELCQADRERLDAILAALQNCGTPFPAPERLQDASESVSALHSTTAPEHTTEATKTASTAPSPATDIDSKTVRADIQRKVVALAAAGKKAEVRDIVKAYADKVSAIPADKLLEVMDKLVALQGQNGTTEGSGANE